MKELFNSIVHCASCIVHQSKTLALLLVMLMSVNMWGEDEVVATFESGTVVTSSGYSAYSDDDWSLSIGGNNNSCGFNKNNKTQIGNAYGTIATTTHHGYTIVSKNKLDNVYKMTFVFTGKSANGTPKLYLGYSTDGSNWSAVELKEGTGLSKQGDEVSTINTTYTFEFKTAISSAYYAIIHSASQQLTTSSHLFRFDGVTATFYASAEPFSVTLKRHGQTDEVIDNLTSAYTLPAVADEDPACDGWEFMGWSNGEVSSTTTAPTFVTQATATGTYHAVYGKTEDGGSVTYSFSIVPSDFTTGGYAANDGEHTSTATAAGKPSQTVTWTSKNAYQNNSKIQIKKDSGSGIKNTTIANATVTLGEGSSNVNVKSDANGFSALTNGSTAYATSINVSYTVGSSTTTYTTSPECGPVKVTATVLANPTDAGSVSAEDGDENPVTSETELNPEDIIIVTATESNDDYYFYNWTKATGDDAEIEEAKNATTVVMMGEKNATITANFFPWANLSVSPTSKDLELPLASADGSFEVTVTSDQDVAFDNNLEAIVTTGDGEKATILAGITSSTANSATYEVQYEFTAAGDYVATIEFTGTDNQSKAANSATLTINATVKDIETLDAPEVTAEKTAKSVTLTWDDVEHAQSYNVTFDGETVEGVTSPWEKTGLLAGTTHTYSVTAVGDGVTYISATSEEAEITTTKKTAVDIKDPVFVKASGKYLVGETAALTDFTVTRIYNDDTEASGQQATSITINDAAPVPFTEAQIGQVTVTLHFSSKSVTIDVPVEDFPKYTVKFSVPSCITAVPDAKVNQGSPLDLTSIVAGDPQYLEGYSFAGWSKESIAEGSASGKLITSYTPTADNTTLYAVYKYDKQQGTAGWVKEDLANLSATDVFVITGTKGETTYSMSNDRGTQNAPTATSVTVNGNKITSTISDNQKWNVSGNATDGYVFYPNGVTDKYLYATNTNNGVRVGTGDAKAMTITNGYLTPLSTKRYIGVYTDGPDWRCYTSYTGSSNIKDQTFAYYKYQAGGDVYKYTSTIDCSEPHTVSVPQAVTGGTVSASPTSAKVGATITVTYVPADNYTVGTLTWKVEGGEAQDLNPVYGTTEYTFTMPDANVTIAATFEEIEHVNISWVIDGEEPQVIPTVKGAQVAPPTVTETCNPSIKFMGWTASETVTSRPDDLFNAADAPLATEDKTYYSVYAQESEGLQPADDAFYTLTFSKLSGADYSTYTAAHDYTDGSNYTWSIVGNQTTDDPLRMGGKNTTATNRTIIGSSKIPSKVAKITLNHKGIFEGTNTTLTINYVQIEAASDEEFVNIVGSCKIDNPSFSVTDGVGSINFTPESGTIWPANSYYRFTLNYQVTGLNNSGIKINNFAFYTNGGTDYSGYSTTCQAPVTIADPEFTVPSGKYTETQHVEITCETAGVTIYYTKDGSNPKDSETKQTYSTAVEIEEPGATLKAIATDGLDHWSNVVMATYDVDKGYVTSIADFITRDPKEPYGLKWTDDNSAYITGIKSESGDKVSLFVQDASAGIIISNITLQEDAAVGKKMVGTITGKHSVYNFQEQLTGADFTNIVFSEATRPNASEVTALDAEAYAANPMKLVKLTNVKFQSTTVAASNTVKDASENEYVVYNTLGMMTGKVLPDADVTCDVTGILVKFGYSTDKITYELLPVLVSDIDTKGTIAAAPTFNPEGAETIDAAVVADNSEVALTAAANCKINYGAQVGVASTTAYLTNLEGEGVTVTSTRDFYANNTVTRYFKADPKSIKYAINGLGTDDKGNKVQAKVDGEFVTNTYKDAEVTLIFTPATHYTTTSATLDGEPLSITDNQATFTMKGQEVTIATIFTEDAKATATFAAGGATIGSVADITKYVGEKFNLPANGFTYDNHKFLGWKLSDDETLYQPNEEITMVDGGFAYTAQWQEKPNFANYDWKLVESSSDIAVGNYYVIASNANGAVAGAISGKYMSAIENVTISTDKQYLTLPTGAVILSLESAGSGNWYFVDADTDKKLGSSSAGTMVWDKETMTWSIAVGDNGALTITNTGSGIGTLRYNSGSPRFTTYTSTSMALPQFYMAVKKTFKISYDANGQGGKNIPSSSVADENYQAVVTSDEPTRFTYDFQGWNTTAEGDGTSYKAGDVITLSDNITLFAQWSKSETIKPIVIVAEYGDKYYAMNQTLSSGAFGIQEVFGIINNKVINVTEEEKKAISWYRTEVEGGYTFQNGTGEYLSYSGSNLALSETPTIWTLNDKGHYVVTVSSTVRSFIYQHNYGFKNYAESNIGGTNYAKEMFVCTDFVYGTELYSRDITLNEKTGTKIGTICLWKNMVEVEGGIIYTPDYKDHKGVDGAPKNIEFIEEPNPQAGVPYAFEADKTKLVVLLGEDEVTDPVNDPSVARGMVGTFTEGEVVPPYSETGNSYCFKDEKVYRVGANMRMHAYYAYINLDDVPDEYDAIQEDPSAAPRRRMSLLNADAANTPTGNDDVLSGAETIRKMIINEKFVIFRNGKLFNAASALIK